MTTTMSLAARREMLLSIRQRYLAAKRPKKTKILDGFVAATGYDRKYALVLLCKKSSSTDIASLKPKSRPGAQVYDDQFRHVLIKVWNTANQVCYKRFVPFIPDLVAAMERYGHLRISDDIRKKLMTVSAATVDRILQPERYRQVQGLSQTKAGALLKSKIQVRTFADWNDIVPGFYEVDLVAHCGDDANGTFLNSLVMVDVSTGWLECMPLLRKSAADVINGVSVARSLMPFPLLGLDTDGGYPASITLNPLLVKTPRDCIDYVILHELCHIAEHNHSERFYRLMGQVMPNWENVKNRLDDMAGKVFNG